MHYSVSFFYLFFFPQKKKKIFAKSNTGRVIWWITVATGRVLGTQLVHGLRVRVEGSGTNAFAGKGDQTENAGAGRRVVAAERHQKPRGAALLYYTKRCDGQRWKTNTRVYVWLIDPNDNTNIICICSILRSYYIIGESGECIAREKSPGTSARFFSPFFFSLSLSLLSFRLKSVIICSFVGAPVAIRYDSGPTTTRARGQRVPDQRTTGDRTAIGRTRYRR